MALTDNIVAYWKLDESSGNASDSVGSVTLTNVGTLTYGTGKINNAADGGSSNTTKYLEASSNLGIDGGAMSVSCWINPTTQPNFGIDDENFFFGTQNNTSDVSYMCSYYRASAAGNAKVIGFNRLKNGIANGWLNYTVSLTLGTWYHVVCTYDGSNSRIYLDGTLVAGPTAFSGSGSATISDLTRVASMPQVATPSGRSFSGLVDEVGVWSRAITSTEVTSLYNAGAGLAYPFVSGPANLKSYNTNVKANIKSVNTNTLANIKSLDTNV